MKLTGIAKTGRAAAAVAKAVRAAWLGTARKKSEKEGVTRMSRLTGLQMKYLYIIYIRQDSDGDLCSATLPGSVAYPRLP